MVRRRGDSLLRVASALLKKKENNYIQSIISAYDYCFFPVGRFTRLSLKRACWVRPLPGQLLATTTCSRWKWFCRAEGFCNGKTMLLSRRVLLLLLLLSGHGIYRTTRSWTTTGGGSLLSLPVGRLETRFGSSVPDKTDARSLHAYTRATKFTARASFDTITLQYQIITIPIAADG